MNKLEYFGKVIKVVTELIDVEDKDIVGGARFVDAVDARWLVIQLMHEKGYKTRQIAPLVGSSIRSVNHALAFFEDRSLFSENDLLSHYKAAQKELAKVR